MLRKISRALSFASSDEDRKRSRKRKGKPPRAVHARGATQPFLER
ncbi:hypothetical protein GCK32_004405, partial [Trichostrongylus colubriformis]